MKNFFRFSTFFLAFFFYLSMNSFAADKKDISKLSASAKSKNKSKCVVCHSTLSGKLKKPVSLWEKSVHAKNGNECNICHGGNPNSMDKAVAKSSKFNFVGKPDNKKIVAFCGRDGCHATALEQFKRGPHYQSVLKTREPSCISCHGIHNIQKSSLQIINDKSCSKCHPAKYAKAIVKSISVIENDISSIQSNIDYLTKKNINISKFQKNLDRARHLFHQMVHVFSKEDIKSTKTIIELQLQNLKSESKQQVGFSKRLDIFYIMMVIFGLTIAILFVVYTMFMFIRRNRE